MTTSNSLFKATVDQEISSVFLNELEFAEPVMLDGVEIIAIVDRDDMEFPDVTDERLQVVSDAVTLRVRRECLEMGRYLPGKYCMFNGERWHIYSCDKEDIVTLRLYKERS